MNDCTVVALKLLFLLGFTLHNLEEAVWLPEWSRTAKKYHEPVERHQFIFAVIIITVIGYLVALFDIMSGESGSIPNYVFLGFVGMMGINSIFPHLISTLILKKYAPGLLTGVLLNLPISSILIVLHIQNGIDVYCLLVSIVGVSGAILFSLKYLFVLGEKLIKY